MLSQGLSYALSPSGIALAVVASLWLGPVGPTARAAAAPLWAGSALAVLPAALLWWLGRHAGVTDVFDPPPPWRQRMLLAGTSCYILSYGLFSVFLPEAGLLWAAASFAAAAACVWAIDRAWKISIHCTGAGGGAVLLAAFGPPGLPAAVWLLLPLLTAWARWQRRAHTPAQLLAGACLGAGVTRVLREIYL